MRANRRDLKRFLITLMQDAGWIVRDGRFFAQAGKL
jgi:hypothetical protein